MRRRDSFAWGLLGYLVGAQAGRLTWGLWVRRQERLAAIAMLDGQLAIMRDLQSWQAARDAERRHWWTR